MKIDVVSARARAGSRYPKPVDEPCLNKTRRRLGLAAGLTQFGVNLLELGPGAWSSQRHWHAHEDGIGDEHDRAPDASDDHRAHRP